MDIIFVIVLVVLLSIFVGGSPICFLLLFGCLDDGWVLLLDIISFILSWSYFGSLNDLEILDVVHFKHNLRYDCVLGDNLILATTATLSSKGTHIL